MHVFKCKMCGGTLNIDKGMTIAECEFCGSKQTIPKLDDEKRANLYDRANHFRRTNDYDKAMGIYELILNEDKTDAEAYWSILLCKYGVEYVEDPVTHKRIPTINRTQFTSITKDDDYQNALKYADGYQRDIYKEQAKEIEKIQEEILAISGKEEPFDVFICYKETDYAGRRTIDSVIAQDLYKNLQNEGLKVFFSRITLEDKLGSAYEPYIFAALNSAKVMVVLGSKLEYFNAVWVKNEWARYLSLIRKGEKKTLVPAYKDIDPYDLPEEFAHLQAQDMNKLGFMQDLVYGIKKILGKTDAKTVVKETIVVDNNTVAPLLRRAYLFLEDNDFEGAEKTVEKILDVNPECAEAYFIKLLIELGLSTPDQIAERDSVITEYANYKKALRFADKQFEEKLNAYNEAIFQNVITKKKEATYTMACERMANHHYLNAIEAFEEIGDFKDSIAKIQQCKDLLEIERKEKIYQDAISCLGKDLRVGERTVTQKIADLQLIIDYKDARQKVLLLQNKLAQIQEYNLKIQEENLKRQRELEIHNQKLKKSAKIVFPSFLSLVLIIVLTFTLFVPIGKYNKADKLLNSGNYAQAEEIYKDLNGFKKSELKVATISVINTINNKQVEKGICNALTLGIKVNVIYELNKGAYLQKDKSASSLSGQNEKREETLTYTRLEDFSGILPAVREGFDFLRWELDSCSAQVTSKTSEINVRLKAVWDLDYYSISYDLDGGFDNEQNPLYYTYDDFTIILTNPTRTGYIFLGWTGTDLIDKTLNVTIPTCSSGNRSYKAHWQANTYTVKYDANGGVASKTEDIATFDSAYTLATVNTRLGYTFKGWKLDGEIISVENWMIDNDVTLVAEWELVKYNISYVLNGGYSTNSSSYTIESGITLEKPTKEGYTFTGWTGTGLDGKQMEVDIPAGSYGNRVYTAQWQVNTYTVKYDANGGVASKTQDTATFDSAYTLATVNERAGYVFIGWMADGSLYTNDTWVIAKDITLIAEWDAIDYNISYVLNGGSDTNVKTYTIEDQVIITAPYRVGYTFMGWTGTDLTEPTNEIVIEKGTMGDKEYVANWQPNGTPYAIEYYFERVDSYLYAKDDSLTLNKMGITDQVVSLDAEIEKFEHFTFNESISITTANIAGDGSTKFKLYYSRNQYSLTTNMPEAGEVTNQGKYKYGSISSLTSEVTVYKGYNFIGWYSGDQLLSTSTSYTFPADKNVTATFELEEELSLFNFTSTANDCIITGPKNEDITEVIIPEVATEIAMNAFNNSASLRSVKILNGTTSIGAYAFANCLALESVEIADSVTNVDAYAFSKCILLKQVKLSQSLTSLSSGTFEYCSSLESIVIPDTVTSIGKQAFFVCSKLKDVSFPSKLQHIGEDAFYSTKIERLSLPEGLLNIGQNAFLACDSLMSVEIPSTVTEIGYRAFDGCDILVEVICLSPYFVIEKESDSNGCLGLNALIIASHSGYVSKVTKTNGMVIVDDGTDVTFVKYLGSETTVKIPENVTKIRKEAFANNATLKEVEIPASVNRIEDSAFSKCSVLREIKYNAIDCILGNYVFDKAGASANGIILTIGKDVVKTPNKFFSESTAKLIEVKFEENSVCETIDYAAFKNCSFLTSVSLPKGLKVINSNAFEGCSSLTQIVIPAGVTTMGPYVFNKCPNLTIYCEAESMPQSWSEYVWNPLNRPVYWGYVG